MYCKNCGEVLVDGQALCKKCGTPVVGFEKDENEFTDDFEIETTTKTKNEETKLELEKMVENAAKVEKTKKKKNPFAIIFLLLFILVVVGGFITYDKVLYKYNSEKEVEKEEEVVKAPTPREDKELLDKKILTISLNGKDHTLYTFFYKSTYQLYVFDEVTQTNSLVTVDSVEREIYLDDKEVSSNKLVDTVREENTMDNIVSALANSAYNYVFTDNSGKEYLGLAYRDVILNEGSYTDRVLFSIYDENNNSIFEKEIAGPTNYYFLKGVTPEELGDRKNDLFNDSYVAYYNEEFHAHYEVRLNSLFTLENNGEEVLEKRYTISDGEVKENIENTFLKTDPIVGYLY